MSILNLCIIAFASLFFLEFVAVVGKFETTPTTVINYGINCSKPYVETAGYYVAEGIDLLGYCLASIWDTIYDICNWIIAIFHNLYIMLQNVYQWIKDRLSDLLKLMRDFINLLHNIYEWFYNIWKNIKLFFSELFTNLIENFVQTFKNFGVSFDKFTMLTEDFGRGIYNYLEENYNYFSCIINDKINDFGNSDYFTLGAYAILLGLIAACIILTCCLCGLCSCRYILIK